MKKFFFFIALLIFFAGCKKKSDGEGPCKLVQVDVYGDGVFMNATTYEYDNSQRLKKIIAGSDITFYEYFTDSVVIRYDNTKTTYFLNSGGIATSAKSIFIQNPFQMEFDYNYTYDTEGFLVRERRIFSQLHNGNILKDTTFTNYTISNSNVIKVASTYSADINYEYSGIRLKYNHPALNQFPSGIGSFLGKALNNILTLSKDNAGNIYGTYTYTTDNDGNVKQLIYKDNLPSATVFKTVFKYSCN